jgi:hypothetical protein
VLGQEDVPATPGLISGAEQGVGGPHLTTLTHRAELVSIALADKARYPDGAVKGKVEGQDRYQLSSPVSTEGNEQSSSAAEVLPPDACPLPRREKVA